MKELPMNHANHLARSLILLVVAITLLGGLGSGLARMGWQVGTLSHNWMLLHGPLMICGFLGTVICLERAVALAARSRWGLAVPIVNAAGALALLVMPDPMPAKLLIGGKQPGSPRTVWLFAAAAPATLYGHHDMWGALLGIGQPIVGGRATHLPSGSPVDGFPHPDYRG